MLKIVVVALMMVVCCYCLENNELLVEDSRAKKKKSSARLWAYAPVSSTNPQELEKFWETARDVLDLAEVNERIIMCGDLNGWVGTKRSSYEAVLGPYRDKRVNDAAMILLLVFSKVAALKVASFFMFMAFFQKIFYIVGLLLNFFLKNKTPASPKPQPVYGAPQDYNTVGYSYGPPEQEAFASQEPGHPAISELGGSLNWLFNKNP